MNIGHENMLKRWNALSDFETYGFQPAGVACTIHTILEQLAQNGQISDLSTEQERLLMGFEVNTGYDAEDGFRFTHCLDLHTVSVDYGVISALDDYFMNSVKINGISFWNRWLANMKKTA